MYPSEISNQEYFSMFALHDWRFKRGHSNEYRVAWETLYANFPDLVTSSDVDDPFFSVDLI
jgi:hypothetical protein